MLIEVKQEHIDKANKALPESVETTEQAFHCPIAQALREAFHVNYAIITYNNVQVGKFPDDNLIFHKSTLTAIQNGDDFYKVHNFMQHFDFGNRSLCKPFSFELSLEGVKL